MVSWLWGSHGYWDGSLVLFSLPRIFHGITIRIVKDTMRTNAPTSVLAATTSVIVMYTYFWLCSRARVRVSEEILLFVTPYLRPQATVIQRDWYS